MCRRTRFCQFEHLCARICRTKSGGGREARICRTGGSRWARRLSFANSSTCALEFAGPRGVVGWAKEGTLGFANSSTCALEFAGPREVVGWTKEGTLSFANSSTCALEFAGPREVVGWTKEGTLSFANSSTCALEFAGPGVVDAQEDSVLPIRALACSNLQNWG